MNDELRAAIDLLRVMVINHSTHGGGESEAFELVREAVEQSHIRHSGPIECQGYGKGETMNDELKAAIRWARETAQDGPYNEYVQNYLHILVDAAERSVDPPTMELAADTITAQGMIADILHAADLLDEVASGTTGPHCAHLLLTAKQLRWIAGAVPKPELRCPWCDATDMIVTQSINGGWYWDCRECYATGPRKDTRAEARASAEVKR